MGKLFPLMMLCAFCAGIGFRHGGAHAEESLKPFTETIPGSTVKFEMLAVPGGKFKIGSPESEKGRNKDEGPQKEIALKPFWMGKCEVTWDEYDLYAYSTSLETKKSVGTDISKLGPRDLASDAVTRPTPPYLKPTFGHGHDGYPVICMTRHGAMHYCEWLSAKTGRHYRLPTEAEWEYAARAGSTTTYFWGDDASKSGEYAWSSENADKQPHPVGQKKPNAWGFFDIAGNVAEWTIERYSANAYEKLADGVVNPANLAQNGKRYPDVARGGGWDLPGEAQRAAMRRFSTPKWSVRDPNLPQSIWWHTDATYVGFRLVCTPDDNDPLISVKSKVVKSGPDDDDDD